MQNLGPGSRRPAISSLFTSYFTAFLSTCVLLSTLTPINAKKPEALKGRMLPAELRRGSRYDALCGLFIVNIGPGGDIRGRVNEKHESGSGKLQRFMSSFFIFIKLQQEP